MGEKRGGGEVVSSSWRWLVMMMEGVEKRRDINKRVEVVREGGGEENGEGEFLKQYQTALREERLTISLSYVRNSTH